VHPKKEKKEEKKERKKEKKETNLEVFGQVDSDFIKHLVQKLFFFLFRTFLGHHIINRVIHQLLTQKKGVCFLFCFFVSFFAYLFHLHHISFLFKLHHHPLHRRKINLNKREERKKKGKKKKKKNLRTCLFMTYMALVAPFMASAMEAVLLIV